MFTDARQGVPPSCIAAGTCPAFPWRVRDVSRLGAWKEYSSALASMMMKTKSLHGSITLAIGWQKFETCPMWGAKSHRIHSIKRSDVRKSLNRLYSGSNPRWPTRRNTRTLRFSLSPVHRRLQIQPEVNSLFAMDASFRLVRKPCAAAETAHPSSPENWALRARADWRTFKGCT